MPEQEERPVRFGVMGCASVAERKTLPAMAHRPAARIVAIASRTRAKAEGFTARFGGTAVEGYERLLERDDVEAVYIPLPALLHAEWIERALLAGKHVLAEKPLTLSHGDSARLVALAAERGLVLAENLMFLKHSQHARVAELVADGVIGELRSLTAEFAYPPKTAENDIRYRKEGGGTLWESGIYPVRTAQLHLGAELEVVGAARHDSAEHGVDLSGAALLASADGAATAHLAWGIGYSYRSAYALWGSRGRIVVTWAYTPPADHRPVVWIEGQDRREELTLAADDQFGNAVDAFVSAVRHGTESGLQGEPVLSQADLIERVRARSVRLPAHP
ncbi:Gfo/Idh/MocA family protein [Actinomadura harenae]|uniref:Gfo/Idh/MocA family oxidoreductase n=1 Tax=Actinomadura harenae TaxID=2483351 RepID=A0A3M2M3Z2_9ACTN|nr:Gfo/Idh/MocA family oxidoreductase [Actinomadura harenae]RMI43185.1 gfo/Idh/MocA family oxidoreductase [Actinomadura harenae]